MKLNRELIEIYFSEHYYYWFSSCNYRFPQIHDFQPAAGYILLTSNKL